MTNSPENIDYLIMKLRTLAKMRGATPPEIQRNVNRLWDAEAQLTLRAQYIDNV